MLEKKFQIGDHVAFINDTTKGVITSISDDVIKIKCQNDFEIRCTEKEIIKIGDMDTYLGDYTHNAFLKKNRSERIRISNKKSSKKNKIIPMEVDLHINQLVENTTEMTNYEMLNLQINTAKRKLEYAINNNIQKVVFIHGIGEGVLKSELHFLLKKYPVQSYDASYQKYGFGATEVHIKQNAKKSN